ncbi:ABC transporter ATP-binding protein [Paenibacillus cymbidii]|uniref:ABC transporter ATP-binding protein n=1 Tax=Paenibacillus cymbidii TaxID=1639034 RepID=UPI0010800931|nr:ABC transporter transmembrane domain-containing protein [Paenibacillus cymbidii]
MFAVMRKLGWFFRLEWGRYALAIALLIPAGAMEIVPPMLVGRAIDAIQLETLTWQTMTTTLLQLGGITIGVYIISYFWVYKLFGGSFAVERMLRSKLMRQLLRMTPTFFARNRTGDLMARATNDLSAVAQTAGFGIMTLIDSTLWMATLLLVMSIGLSWKLTLACLLPLPLMAGLLSLYGSRIHRRFMEAQDAFGEMNDGVLETIGGIRVIRAYVKEREAERQFAAITQKVLGKNLAVVRIEALFEPTVKVLVGISYLIGLGYGALLVYRGELTVGALVSFNVYLGMLIWPMFAIGELINIMQRGNASLDRVNETLGYKPDVPEPADDAAAGAGNAAAAQPGAIVFRGVTFRYPSAIADNLADITFTLEQGQTLGIVGRTGSGKSTLIKQLLREYPVPDAGEIALGDVPIDRIGLDRLKSWYGYVPQEQFLFSRTVRENIRFGKDGASDGELAHAVAMSAFAKDAAFLPRGLETLVGEKGAQLSGGQKQRISIARALIADPPILLLDDAMSAVDARTEAEIIANIREQRAGKTTLIATHRLSAVEHADWILVLDEGRIVEQGTHAELLAAGGWYREQFERQQAEVQKVGF